MDERNETQLFGIGFITGATLGLVLGILYAPKPGREIRSAIKEKATIARTGCPMRGVVSTCAG